ncbi:UDP-glucose:glyco protein glucosyltransferase [Sodiomyces alkalinus F11]|uniref:UDP-glucose:glyco protein glucosyltransferase n=1 Tax=Sodiomyces alkalinus (strain CBS 110278 / VKM F-3762 / F11) TaxID=1314773 RepID=A0A3N2PTN8_SODAK|nr:UDP-glucose:glyco protein glucosyltransferase [Sodiomyces alkalinus F11]ROT37875.1 UDP-glucose:glyco protein glucosyltransferase [Sodiomyces alkalinus F11]
MIRLSKLPLGFALSLLAAIHVSAVPSVNVAMNAAFPAGPYLIELLETAAGENETSYFPLLDRVASGYFQDATSDKALYEKFLEVLQEDGHITSTEALSTFKLSLSTRSAAPRIEAHYQYYDTAILSHLADSSQDGCDHWAQLDGQQFCSPSLDSPRPSLPGAIKQLAFDRVLGTGKDAILYADPASPSFGAMHEILARKARNGEVSYRLRYRRSSVTNLEPLPVSGYGVELALKKTDYIVIDDRETGQDDAQKTTGTEVVLDEEEEVEDLKPLSTSELGPLGIKAASFILRSQDPWDALLKLTQDFPKFSTSVAAHDASDEFVAAHMQNQLQVAPGGVNVMLMNGVRLSDRQFDAFTLVDKLRQERKLVNSVRELGFSGKQATSLLGHQEIAAAQAADEPLRFDWRDEQEDGRVIIWLNDLENDEAYKDFPAPLQSLLQRTYPGQLPPIRRNVFNLVVPVDFTQSTDLKVVNTLHAFVQRRLPVRFGLVPIAATEDKANQAQIVYHLLETYGIDTFVEYLQKAVGDDSHPTLNQTAFDLVVNDAKVLPDGAPSSFDQVIQSEDLSKQVRLAQHWVKRAIADTPTPTMFVNGLPASRDNSWLQTMSAKITADLKIVQQAVFRGLVGEDDWVPGLFLQDAVSRRNPYIEDTKSVQVLDVNKLSTDHRNLFSQIPIIQGNPEATKENWAVLTVVLDATTDLGKNLLFSALQFRRNNPGIQLEVLHNPEAGLPSSAINHVLKEQQDTLLEVESLAQLQQVLLLDGAEPESDNDYAAALASFLSATGIAPGSNKLILNGRVLGPINAEFAFGEEDFQQFFDFELKARILPVYAALKEMELTDRLSDPVAAAKLTSIIALSTIPDVPEGIFDSGPATRVNAFQSWDSTATSMEVGDAEEASIHLVGLLDPVSEQAQAWVPILKVLSELDGVYVKLFLNPKDNIEELPVKRFFRYVLESEPSFDESGKVRAPRASFKALPSEALMTVGMSTPPAWLVFPKISAHDLDNIRLSSVKGDIEATYQLEHILIEGHSREGKTGNPPRGAQLVLGTEDEPHFADTIIMANLGYFQFKANPGIYNIQLKEGRTSEIYTIESIGAKGWTPVPGDEGTDVALMDFLGTTLYPRLNRKPGQEEADVLEEPETEGDGGIIAQGLKFAEGLFGGGGSKSTKSVSAQEHAEINIFSMASGHLYERMLNIMMASVMKHTKHTVKFWFMEQFLSPSFKDFLPHMAAEYGFRYEMVAYKWPHWLRQQKYKEREIWGYKILFLDVLFPLSLDKVIFVDADQIVRTDMIDLVRHDLEGKPYGFVPMCDSRTEMEGYRFWKQGYWANYLRGLPYHISALYVVDLRRFRDMAAGDRLRQQYHALSADPNSLSNLDQDLPNNMQFSIPIHSLPQDWLWCETWCSDESLATARTIDLCNNPETKEPKLDRARRQVPEWTAYDEEIAALDRRRKGVPPPPVEAATGGEEQKVVVAEEKETESVQKNPKSRNWEEPPSAESTHKRDEL